MIIYNKLDNYFVVFVDRQIFLGFEMTSNLRDTSPLSGSRKKNAASKKAVRSQLLEMSSASEATVTETANPVLDCTDIAGAAQQVPTKLVLLGAVPWFVEIDTNAFRLKWIKN